MADKIKVDFSNLEFPSDGLTIKTLRRIHSELIDAGTIPSLFDNDTPGSAAELLSDMLHVEREFAEFIFNRKIHGESSAVINEDITGITEELKKLYMKYEIAAGRHHADLLVRNIESQALQQTERFTGRRP